MREELLPKAQYKNFEEREELKNYLVLEIIFTLYFIILSPFLPYFFQHV